MGGCEPKEKTGRDDGPYVGNLIGGRVGGILGYGRSGGNILPRGRGMPPLGPLSPPPLVRGLGNRGELAELVFKGAISL